MNVVLWVIQILLAVIFAAVGLVIVMVGGILVHLRDRKKRDTAAERRMEIQGAITCAVLLVLAAVVAWGRFGPYSF
ncbi:hypothetical protein F8271_17615 [Micromonospora sp. ALFpr18c]|uniref:hypothetical protein n=1 Tax=unclassified Micromonospora TaxID=2617518 RepID=UPI00124B088C|nr:hypothetical protein [Micromonospora sp. ALFpr18c]KAB1938976.1 hypothetical protein F8271_17615 [Micromonospora sp. ALFpr18c]